ncbi:hypothetical protein BC831DRAFT_461803, partial [Entophlyctis helioformis]
RAVDGLLGSTHGTASTAGQQKLQRLALHLQHAGSQPESLAATLDTVAATVAEQWLDEPLIAGHLAETLAAIAACLHLGGVSASDTVLDLARRASGHAHRDVRVAAVHLLGRSVVARLSHGPAPSLDRSAETWILAEIQRACRDETHDQLAAAGVASLVDVHAAHGIWIDEVVHEFARLAAKNPHGLPADAREHLLRSGSLSDHAKLIYRKSITKLQSVDESMDTSILEVYPMLLDDRTDALDAIRTITLLLSADPSSARILAIAVATHMPASKLCSTFASFIGSAPTSHPSQHTFNAWTAFDETIQHVQLSVPSDKDTTGNLLDIDTVQLCIRVLDVPSAFASESGAQSPAMQLFTKQSPAVLSVLAKLLGLAGDASNHHAVKARLPDTVARSILIACTGYLGDPSIATWSSPSAREAASKSLEALRRLKNAATVSDLVASHAQSILTDYIKPLFVHPSITASGARTPWKDSTPAAVSVLQFCASQLTAPRVAPLQHLLLPPVLSLLDDHEPRYKRVGIALLRKCFVQESRPEDVRRTGLGHVFMDALGICVSYMGEDPGLMDDALVAMREMVDVVWEKGSDEWVAGLDRHIREFVMGRFAFAMGGSVKALRILFKEMRMLVGLCPVLVFKTLKATVGTVCEVLEVHQRDFESQVAAADTLIAAIQVGGWARMHMYQGQVLKSVAETWRLLQMPFLADARRNDANARLLGDRLQLLVQLMCQCCPDTIENDLRVLLMIDKPLFGPLLPRNLADRLDQPVPVIQR